MNPVPFLNSVPLRRLIRRHGNLGYLVAGCYLAGYWLYHFKRRETTAILTLMLAAGVFTLWPVTCHLSRGNHLACGSAQANIHATYTVTDLGVVSGYEYSFGEKDNSKGQVAGDLADEEFDKVHGFFHSGAKMTDIGTLGGEISVATGINDNGQIVGTSETQNGEIRGYVWQNGKMNRLGTLGGPYSMAEGINNKGEAVGLSVTSGGLPHAYVWKDGNMRDISAQCPGQYNGAAAINDNSDIAGIFTEDGESVHTFVLSGKQSRPIPTLGGNYAFPTAISNKAHVVGYSTLRGDEVLHAFVWQTSGTKDLGTLGGELSIAYGVNSSGQIVGAAETGSGLLHAVLWEGGKAVDLNTRLSSGSGWELIFASGINDKGRITGWGVVGNSVHAFLLSPQG